MVKGSSEFASADDSSSHPKAKNDETATLINFLIFLS
jgi:hypothetical protein